MPCFLASFRQQPQMRSLVFRSLSIRRAKNLEHKFWIEGLRHCFLCVCSFVNFVILYITSHPVLFLYPWEYYINYKIS